MKIMFWGPKSIKIVISLNFKRPKSMMQYQDIDIQRTTR